MNLEIYGARRWNSGVPIIHNYVFAYSRTNSALEKLEKLSAVKCDNNIVNLIKKRLRYYKYYRVDPLSLDIINTDYEYGAVARAYSQFVEAIERSYRYGRSQFVNEWIIPHDSIPDSLKHSFGTAVNNVNEWLPWMPLAVVQHLRSWRLSRIESLRRALFKLESYTDETVDTRFIPIQVLYQYEPVSLTRATINTLHNCGLTSTNDLRCLHREAVDVAKKPDQPLLKLYQSLSG